MLFSRRFASLVCALFAVLAGTVARAQSYTSVVVFGDSLSDVGNAAHLTQGQFGLRYPSPLFGYTDGRFTDGADSKPAAQAYFGVWVEQMAGGFAAKPAIKASLDGGTDFAYGDATTEDGTRTVSKTVAGLPLSVTIHNLGQQVTDYLATSPTPSGTTLYVIWGGANDLYADSGAAGVTAAAARETALLQRLVDAGGTEFMVPNLPPLGAVPDHAGGSNAAALNAAAASFRVQLATDLGALLTSAAMRGKTLHIYQPDVFTRFMAVAASPMAYGLANVTSAAQGITGNPDTYLIWDGLHPTTTGHHFVAAAAENLLTPLAASTTTLSVSPPTTVEGQAVTLKATVTGTGPLAKATGLVTFFSGTGAGATAIGAAVLDPAGTATTTFSQATVAGSPYTITAVYAGDTAYLNSTSAPATLLAVATPLPTTTTLSSSSVNANQGDPVRLTATVASMTGIPGGTVNFLEGTTTLGSGTLNGSGVATFATSTLAAGSHVITAAYVPSGVFAGSTSAAITVTVTAQAIQFGFSPTSLTIQRGSTGATTITFTPMGGLTGTVVPNCGTLPASLSCTFSPTSVTLSGGAPQRVTLTIGTTAVSGLELPQRPGSRGLTSFYAVLLLPFLGLGAGFAGPGRRRKLRGIWMALLVTTVSAGAMLGLNGCGSSSKSKTAAPGTYTVNVGYTLNGTASLVQHPLQVTVQ